jgi:prepilin-type N-terminal cleavage/methylation domain-containing protein
MLKLPSRRGDDGFTLVELLVVLILMGVVGGVAMTAIVTSLQSAAVTQSRVEALHELETALQRITRDLRVADPLRLSPDATESTLELFETDLGATIQRGGATEQVRYRLIGDADDGPQRLVREDTGQTLVTLVDNGGEPVFSYLEWDGTEIECASGDSHGDCVDKLARAAQIKIRLVRVIGEDRTPVRAETTVSVRSIRYGG